MIQTRRSFLSSGAVLAATACATEPVGPWPKEPITSRMPVVPLQISADNLDRITVCTRPFRPA
ncbi:MAG: D-amino-acid oxidase, partial [Pseudomonadota bacterium]